MEDIFGGVLESREWDLRVHAVSSEEAWLIARDNRTWKKGYELRGLSLHDIPHAVFPI